MTFEGTAISLVCGLLMRLILPQQPAIPMPENPSFIEQKIPPGHYLGISVECKELAKAQEDSLQNVIKQILQQIGAEYQFEFEKVILSENADIDVVINDRFSFSSTGILADIEAKDYSYEKVNNRYVFYTLAYFPQSKIISTRELIEEEHNKRLVQYNLLIKKAKLAESNGKIIEALHHYRMAVKQANGLFRERDTKKHLVEAHIQNLCLRIRLKPVSNYNQRDNHSVSCKVIYNDRPIGDIPVRFLPLEGDGNITPLVYSNSKGIARCDVNLRTGYSNNKMKAWIDIDGIESSIDFIFSSVKPKPIIRASSLEVKNDCFTFEIKEINDVDVVFDKYEVFINAEYKNASFINYYIAHVDSSKHVSRSFSLLNPVKIKGGSSQKVRIPFNRWVQEEIQELDKWYMGCRLDYRVVLAGDVFSITVQ